METSFNRLLIAFALGIGFFSWQSCKERTTTKPDLIPTVDNIHTFQLSPDSLNISMNTRVFDSVKTNVFNANSSPLVALGEILNDPFFGSFSAGVYTQFVPPVANFSFPSPSSATFDSAVLALPYSGFSYGDTSNASGNLMGYKVFRVTQPMSLNDSNDYTFTDYTYDPSAIGGGTYSFKSLTDSFSVGGDTLSNQLRIKLDKNFIYSQIVQADTSNFSSAEKFTDYFNGWYIMPNNTSGPIANRVSYFYLAGGYAYNSARIDFYFHDAANAVKVYSFPYQATVGAYVNRMAKNYLGTPVNSFIQAPHNRDSIVLQGLPGVYTTITIRNLSKIPPSVINQAELVLTAVPVGQDGNFAPPQHLLLEKILSSGAVVPIQDVFGSAGSPTSGGLNFMDGNPNQVAINGQAYTQYKLNFPRELQKAILAGEDSLTFRITASSIYQGSFRMVAPGMHSQLDAKMKLNIIYTKIN